MVKLYKYKEHGDKLNGNIQVLGEDDHLTYMQFPMGDGTPHQALDWICIGDLDWVDGSISDKRMKIKRLDL